MPKSINEKIDPNLNINTILPPEIMLSIFAYLNERELSKIARVSQNWKTLSETSSLWKTFGFLSKSDFDLLRAHEPIKKLTACNILQKKPKEIYITGDLTYKNKIFAAEGNDVGILESTNHHDWRLISAGDSTVLLYREANEPADLLKNIKASSIVLACVTNKKQIQAFTAQLAKRPELVLFFVVPEEHEKQLSKLPVNRIVLKEGNMIANLIDLVQTKLKEVAQGKPVKKSSKTCVIS